MDERIRLQGKLLAFWALTVEEADLLSSDLDSVSAKIAAGDDAGADDALANAVRRVLFVERLAGNVTREA